jgi:hypothetical protein
LALGGPAAGAETVGAEASSAAEVGLFCSHQAAPEAATTPTSAMTKYGFLKDISVSEQYPKQL